MNYFENPSNKQLLTAAGITAAVGATIGAIYYFTTKSAAAGATAVITNPTLIIQAKANLSAYASNPKNQPSGVSYTQVETPASGQLSVITPAFTAGLAQIQVLINQLSADQVAAAPSEMGFTPVWPLRTDGVLDQATFDWLIPMGQSNF